MQKVNNTIYYIATGTIFINFLISIGKKMIKKKFKEQNEGICLNRKRELFRLNKVIDQMEELKKMIKSCEYCMDILDQCEVITGTIQRVEKAVAVANNSYKLRKSKCSVRNGSCKCRKRVV